MLAPGGRFLSLDFTLPHQPLVRAAYLQYLRTVGGLDSAQVSIEAPDAELHDDLTARPGSFDLSLAGIRNLRAAGISVQTNTTVTALNAHLAPLMPAFLKSLGIERFAMNLYIPMARQRTAERVAGAPAGGAGGVDDPLFFPYSRIGLVIDAVRAAARAEGD